MNPQSLIEFGFDYDHRDGIDFQIANLFFWFPVK